MSTAPAPDPTVLLLGCPELDPALRELNLTPVPAPDLPALERMASEVEAHACVVGPTAATADELGSLVPRLLEALPFTPLVLWVPDGEAALVRDAMVAGARDVMLDHSPQPVATRVREVVRQRKLTPVPQRGGKRPRRHDSWRFEGLVSRSPRMWDLFETCTRTAKTDATVLILGETGTGKELIARAIHRRSRRSGHFVALNCGAVPESLIDSELFGHARGAFTDASQDKPGLFRHASGGTLLLDEIGAVPLAVQYRLLRALQEGAIRPVGLDEEVPVDPRVIAATSSPLDEAVAEGTFREDLLYRLDVIRLVLPPLRERPEDIILLFEHFCTKLARQYQLKRPALTDAFLDELLAYDWPGNVRQLENYVERLLLTSGSEKLTAEHFRALVKPFGQRAAPAAHAAAGAGAAVDISRPLHQVVTQEAVRVERAYIEACLRQTRGRMAAAAELAGISRRTLLRKLKSLGIDRSQFRDG